MIVQSLEHNHDTAAVVLRTDRVMVARTDTLYGVIARTSPSAVESVYTLRGRDENKPCIVLIASHEQAFGGDAERLRQVMDAYTATYPTTFIIEHSDAPHFITRGGTTTAYRVITLPAWQKLLEEVGPVIAPSANPQGKAPALNCTTAYEYFGDAVELYIDDGEVDPFTSPSHIVRIDVDGTTTRLR